MAGFCLFSKIDIFPLFIEMGFYFLNTHFLAYFFVLLKYSGPCLEFIINCQLLCCQFDRIIPMDDDKLSYAGYILCKCNKLQFKALMLLHHSSYDNNQRKELICILPTERRLLDEVHCCIFIQFKGFFWEIQVGFLTKKYGSLTISALLSQGEAKGAASLLHR